MTLPLRRLALVMLVLLAAAACTSGRKGTPSMRDDSRGSTVRIENQAWVDVVMYIERSGQRIRLGDVTAQGSRTFRMPTGTLYGSVVFIADPVGSSRVARSFQMTVTPGEQIRLTIPAGSF